MASYTTNDTVVVVVVHMRHNDFSWNPFVSWVYWRENENGARNKRPNDKPLEVNVSPMPEWVSRVRERERAVNCDSHIQRFLFSTALPFASLFFITFSTIAPQWRGELGGEVSCNNAHTHTHTHKIRIKIGYSTTIKYNNIFYGVICTYLANSFFLSLALFVSIVIPARCLSVCHFHHQHMHNCICSMCSVYKRFHRLTCFK